MFDSKIGVLRVTSPRSGGRGLVTFLCGLGVCLASVVVGATPHVPVSDATVLEHVPAAGAAQRLTPLRAQVAAHPEDLKSALALAQGYLSIGRANADPRFVSYAQATLTPWLRRQHPDPAVLTLAATVLQYLHRFDESLQLLDRALAVQNFNGQAWLTKATILEVQGRFDAARQACRPLIQISGQLIALTCLTSVNSLTGKLSASYAALRGVFRDDPRLDLGVRVWILDELADMAQRAGDDGAAEGYFRAALQANSADGYTQAQYADLLLRQHRNAEVLALLQGRETQDNLLLRLSIAAARLHSPDSSRLSDLFQSRYEAARQDGDFTHLREQARFLLDVRADTAQALKLARRDWEGQREPGDVQVYFAAATAARDPAALASLHEWIQQTRYEDVRLGSSAAVVHQEGSR